MIQRRQYAIIRSEATGVPVGADLQDIIIYYVQVKYVFSKRSKQGYLVRSKMTAIALINNASAGPGAV